MLENENIGGNSLGVMVKAIYIPSDFNFHPEYERSFHWNLIVLEKSFVLSEETSGKKT